MFEGFIPQQRGKLFSPVSVANLFILEISQKKEFFEWGI